MTPTDPVADRATNELIGLWRAFGAFERESVCCGTVTVQQCLVLQALREDDATVSGLASSTGTSPSAMTRLVQGLVKRGLVSRHREGADRRLAHLALTPEGRSEADRLHAMTKVGVLRLLLELPEEERAAVGHTLGLVRAALEKVRNTGCVIC